MTPFRPAWSQFDQALFVEAENRRLSTFGTLLASIYFRATDNQIPCKAQTTTEQIKNRSQLCSRETN